MVHQKLGNVLHLMVIEDVLIWVHLQLIKQSTRAQTLKGIISYQLQKCDKNGA